MAAGYPDADALTTKLFVITMVSAVLFIGTVFLFIL
jgi:hypothetical protein